MCKIKNRQSCVLLTSGVFLLRGASNDLVCGPREFHPEMNLEQSIAWLTN